VNVAEWMYEIGYIEILIHLMIQRLLYLLSEQCFLLNKENYKYCNISTKRLFKFLIINMLLCNMYTFIMPHTFNTSEPRYVCNNI